MGCRVGRFSTGCVSMLETSGFTMDVDGEGKVWLPILDIACYEFLGRVSPRQRRGLDSQVASYSPPSCRHADGRGAPCLQDAFLVCSGSSLGCG